MTGWIDAWRLTTVMKVRVDLDRCDSQGLCTSSCPEVFSFDDHNKLLLLQENLPEQLIVRAAAAARACPTRAITIE